ncbi:MAG: hypothetical protein ABFD92_12925 [Planctomycetaceae bacterium]|nr:hypothetical protein [Planctomycetaceae bacterium]
MAEQITKARIRELMSQVHPQNVSITMAMHPFGPSKQEDALRLKNLLEKARNGLMALGVAGARAQRRVDGVAARVGAGHIWENQCHGLAVYLGQERDYVFLLPQPPREMVVVGPRFQIKPLLAAVSPQGKFYILALSSNHVRLYEVDRRSIKAVETPAIPRDYAEATRFNEFQRQVSFHTGTSGHGPGARRPAMFHAQGGGGDDSDKKKYLLDFCHLVDTGLQNVLAGETVPLVLAACEPLAGMFRQCCSYRFLYDRSVDGNPELLAPQDLHALAMREMGEHFSLTRRRHGDLYRQLASTPHASSNIEEILSAAGYGRVETLFVSGEDQCWGRYDGDSGQMEIHDAQQDGDEDLFDLAAAQTFQNGGTIHVLPRNEMPDTGAIAATFRYALSNAEAG